MKRHLSSKYIQYQFNSSKLSKEDIDFLFNNEFNEITPEHYVTSANNSRSFYSKNRDRVICDEIIRIANSNRSIKTRLIISHPDFAISRSSFTFHTVSEDLPSHIFLCFEREDGLCLFKKKENVFTSVSGYGFVPIQLSYDPLFL